jgi:hypothetical protein
VPEYLRGRCAQSRVVQAAEALARAAGAVGNEVDGGRVLSARAAGLGRHEVTFAGAPPLTVVVQERAMALGGPATCRATGDEITHAYELLRLDREAVR